MGAVDLISHQVQATGDFLLDNTESESELDFSLNGLILNGILIPETAIETLLTYVDASDIVTISQVCRLWKDIITNRWSFWKRAFQRHGRLDEWKAIPLTVKENHNSWIVFEAALKNSILTKNYVKNHSGHDRFEHWTILSRHYNFLVESPPQGIADLPPIDPKDFRFSEPGVQNDSAFVATYGWCSMQQKIDLWEAGLTPEVMKSLLPFQFYFSPMVGCRFDCGGTYKFNLHLADSSGSEAKMKEISVGAVRDLNTAWGKSEAYLVVDDASNVDLNSIRYLVITMDGKDTRFWAGHYGIKFSRISLTVQPVTMSLHATEKS